MTRKIKSPAFQFYPKDYIVDEDVALMNLAQEGIYVRLMSYCWLEGSIPLNPNSCAALVGKGATVEDIEIVQKCFSKSTKCATRLVHARLEIERRKQSKFKQACSKAGVNSGKSRRNKLNEPMKVGSTNLEPKVNSSSSFTSSSSDVQRERGTGASETRQATRKPKDIAECVDKAAFIGVTKEDAEQWYRDCEIAQWKRGDGTPFDNWPRQLAIHRDRLRESRAKSAPRENPPSGYQPAGQKVLSGADKILRSQELQQVEEKIQRIAQSYSGMMSWSTSDITETKRLKALRRAIKQELGYRV